MLSLRRRPHAAYLIAALFAGVSSIAPAQAALGPGDDAWHVPGGVVRFGLSTRFFFSDDGFGPTGARAPLGAPMSGTLSSTELPTFQWLEASVRNASGSDNFRATIGTARADLRRVTARIPLELAFGVTSRVMVFGSVPFHTGEQEVNWLLNGSGATIGPNPMLTANAAATGNAAVIAGLDSAAARLEVLAAGCAADPMSDPRCAQITAELAQVQQLIGDSRATTDDLAPLYGGRTGVAPSPYVPMTDGDAHNAVLARLAALRAAFDRYGTESIGEGAGPAGAGVPLTVAELRQLLESPEYSYLPIPVTRRYQQGIGDMDAGLSLLVFDGIRDTTKWGRLGPMSFGVRQSIAAAYRFATGTAAHPDDPLQIATGDGQDDIEFTSATDIAVGRHAWASVLVRYTIQRPADGIARIPDASGSPFIPLERRRNARHELGNRLDVSVSPRWVLNDFAAVGLGYRWMRQDAERYDEIAPFTDAIPLSYEGVERSAHEVGIGFTWSSVASWRRGSARWPIEIQWDHRMVVAGEGGVLRASSDRIALRAYARLWGR